LKLFSFSSGYYDRVQRNIDGTGGRTDNLFFSRVYRKRPERKKADENVIPYTILYCCLFHKMPTRNPQVIIKRDMTRNQVPGLK